MFSFLRFGQASVVVCLMSLVFPATSFAQAPKVTTRSDGTQEYIYHNGADCLKRADYSTERTTSGKLSITTAFSGEGSVANKVVNAAARNPSMDAIYAALFDACASYGSGLITKETYDTQRKALSDLQLEAIKRLIDQPASSSAPKPAPSSDKSSPSSDKPATVPTAGKVSTPTAHSDSALPKPQPVTPSSNNNYDDLFKANQGDEQKLAALGEDAFARLDYNWSLKFFQQAKLVESTRVWERDYPLLAASYLLASGDRDKFKSTLQDMLAAMRTPNTFLHHRAGMGMALQSLSNARIYLDKDAQSYIDNEIVPAAIQIQQTF